MQKVKEHPALYVYIFLLAFALIAGIYRDVTRESPSCERATAEAIIVAERPNMGPRERTFWLDALEAAAKKHALPLAVVTAKIAQESKFRGHLVSEAGAKGAAQLMPMWVKGFDPFEIEANLDKGAEVLALERKTANGDMARALRRYNGGPYGENGAKAKLYVAEVLARVYTAQTKACKMEPAK